ncbi:MAG TPA: RNB domain-containing ribonuclease [Steroidobacteraceae bacterium]|nr:RNB domain-containing ribonuclease [Steroidobacteraceae bacterium]
MLERGLLPEFSPQARVQAERISAPALATSDPSIRDLRGLLWASIDNDDSRDLDQLSVAEPVAGGGARILVAIADVDAVVPRSTPIDTHARTNTTSVYTVPQTFPMLPEKLSTDLTSLVEGQERVAVVIDIAVDADGTLGTSEIYRARVQNRAKLSYRGVGPWLAGTAPAPLRLSAVPGLDRQLRLQDELAQALRSARCARGALTLETIEARPVFHGEVLADLKPDHKNRANDLIEDFMIAANGVSARYLASHGAPSLRRVLKTPRKWGRIVELAAEVGEHLPAEPSAPALNDFLAARRRLDPARFADLSLCVVKLLGRGEYVVDLPGQPAEGHFALAVSDYTHSTAPNRRFPDLLTQRLLKATLSGSPIEYTGEELRSLAAHCTRQEDNAAKVERRLAKSAAALLLAGRIGEPFDAIVTGAADKGTWARISSPTVEGRIVTGFEGLEVGDHVRVKLIHTDVERGFIDFEHLG